MSTPPRRSGLLSRLRGFTLIELIVVILILGILAAIAVVGYTSITDRAEETAAQANLANIAKAIMVEATVTQSSTLDRDLVTAALEDSFQVTVDDGLGAASTWYLGDADYVPTGADEYAVGFSDGTRAYDDTAGVHAVVIASSGGRLYQQTVSLSGGMGFAEAAAGTAPADVDPTVRPGDGNEPEGPTEIPELVGPYFWGEDSAQPYFMAAMDGRMSDMPAGSVSVRATCRQTAVSATWAPPYTPLEEEGAPIVTTAPLTPVAEGGIVGLGGPDGWSLMFNDMWDGHALYRCTVEALGASGHVLAAKSADNITMVWG